MTGGDDTAAAAGDPAVPIVDIPPNEDLALSEETLAAVATISEGLALETPAAVAETAEAIEVPEIADIPIDATEEDDLMTGIESTDALGVADDNGAETTTTTTTTVVTVVTETLTSVLVPDAMATTGDTAVLGKREKADEAPTAAAGGEEEGPPSKKVKAVTDEKEGAEEAEEKGVQQNGGEANPKPVQLGPRTFHSGVEMFTYFYDLLHAWVSNVDLNKYEFLVLSDLIAKGHRDVEAKIGSGIGAFQVRFHPGWRSRCYYLVRTDGSVDDFSYRKCVDKIMPLPENLYSPSGNLLVEKLFGPEQDKWSKKKGKENFGDGWKHNHHGGGQHNRGGGRGDRRGGGRGGFRV